MKFLNKILLVPLLTWSFAGIAEPLRLEADKAFTQGNYQTALNLYQKALNGNGANTESDWALQYNMAVCYFKLSHWQRARTAFMALDQQQPGNPLVVYSLAVTEKKLGNTDLAADIFYDLSQSRDDSGLAQLAERQWYLLQGDLPPSPAAGEWIASIDVSYGIDDNVIDSSTSESTEDSDGFLETLATARWYSDGLNKSDAWYIEGTGLFSRYQSATDYDTDFLIIGAGKSNRTGYGSWQLGGRVDSSQLGGEDYLQTFTVYLGLEGDFTSHSGWAVNIRNQHISSQNAEYDYLQGDNYRVDLAYLGRVSNGLRWKLRYRYDNDERDDLNLDAGLNTDFYSYSAHRHGLMLQGIYLLGEWMVIGKLEHRLSDYKDDHVIDGIIEHRQDNREQISLRAERRLSDHWIVSVDYSYTRNSSSLSQYDYNRGVLMVGAGFQF